MILGIGNDICQVDRIADSIERNGERFLNRVFSGDEQNAAESAGCPTTFYAALFAGKEAISKALGTGINGRVRWTDITLTRVNETCWRAELSGSAARRVRWLGKTKDQSSAWVSTGFVDGFVLAFALIERADSALS